MAVEVLAPDAATEPATDLQLLSLADLVSACAAEHDGFQRGSRSGPGHGMELFRRAICLHDDRAWMAILRQYRGLVLHWVRRHPAAALVREDDEFWVTRTLERFWLAVGPERFARFNGMGPLMSYLKLCVHSVIVDELRARSGTRQTSLTAPDGSDGTEDEAGPGVQDAEAVAVGHLSWHDLWQAVEDELPDESERRLAYLSFVLDLTPNQIARRHPERYPTTTEVYRVKRNVLKRLARSPRLRRFLDQETTH
jgi:DNA-directed RNA polymerase specialized sigma24 family protein